MQNASFIFCRTLQSYDIDHIDRKGDIVLFTANGEPLTECQLYVMWKFVGWNPTHFYYRFLLCEALEIEDHDILPMSEWIQLHPAHCNAPHDTVIMLTWNNKRLR